MDVEILGISIDLNSSPIIQEKINDEVNNSTTEDEEVLEEVSNPKNYSGYEDEVFLNEEFLENGPQVGMNFPSKDFLLEAYQAHAKRKGFCVAIRTVTDNKYMTICCDRGRSSTPKKYTKRILCGGRISAKRNLDRTWEVSKVNADHNHELHPDLTMFMVGHRGLTINMERQLVANDIAGLKPCKNIRLMEFKAGGPQHLGCLPKDCRNYIEKQRRLRLAEGDAESIRRFFMKLQQKDKSFFHVMDIDDEGRLRNVVWIHPRSIAAYEEFHDVVTFDTTYLVNQYNMPFGTVVGVNHHHQSILLGCVLLSHEDITTFKWFFSTWLEVMGGICPKAILTDQCDGIKAALAEVMPNTVHRYCLWHIISKTPTKFKGLVEYDKIVSCFKSMIHNSLSISEFEQRWAEFIVKYNFQEHRWLTDLYNERKFWIPVYLEEIFWAGMVSTQRSESMHAFFDGYINSQSTLKKFVDQYEIAVSHKVHKELQADFDSKCKPRQCISPFKWEEQFRAVYTNTIFELHQKQIKLMWNCNIKNDPTIVEGVEWYDVTENLQLKNQYHKEYTFKVEYRPTGDHLICNCRKFQSKGILCCHILNVLATKGIHEVNERYIMRRWMKNLVRRHSSIIFDGGYPLMTKEYLKFQAAEREFLECTNVAYQDDHKMLHITKRLKEVKEELINMSSSRVRIVDTTQSAMEEDPNMESDTILLDPAKINRRGRPRENRFKSALEINSKKNTKKKKKGGSGDGAGAGENKSLGEPFLCLGLGLAPHILVESNTKKNTKKKPSK